MTALNQAWCIRSPRASPLSRELGVAQPTVSDAAASLVRKGFLTRAADAGDRRVSTLALTSPGRDLARSLDAAGDPLAGAAGALPAGDQEMVLSGLLRMIATLAEAGVVGVARTCLTCRFRGRRPDGDHCELLGVALPTRALRVNCPEHEPSDGQP